jgi:hypothetical protein
MKTAAAWIYKTHSELLGRTFKVQDTNHRLMTGIAYRGAAMCSPLSYAEIMYQDIASLKKCCPKVEPIIQPTIEAATQLIEPEPSIEFTSFSGGNLYMTGRLKLNSNMFNNSNEPVLDGGITGTIIRGGTLDTKDNPIFNGGLSFSKYVIKMSSSSL